MNTVQAISVIFKLSSQPEVTCSWIIKGMACDTIGIGLQNEVRCIVVLVAILNSTVCSSVNQFNLMQSHLSFQQPEEPLLSCSALALARLCFVLGDVALKLLVYSEELFSRLKLVSEQRERERDSSIT